MFKPNESGNLNGRKAEAHLKALARSEVPASVAALAGVRDNPEASPETRFNAAVLLIELAGRKAAVPMEA